ncbi:glycosyltransferase involved in cell wall biosynthesis [Paraburkholderia sp. HC6.4b]|uniref:glycosyltransferase n=1 Tax=unclassified Paraburkholderia TaxID=2615204 RepID=UPI001615D37C|nr:MULTISPECIES: glycosyltransferase [unclassified Paraburkholderia]MBB5409192.1 glycosyltransferase involved in cell wall biosynthesis [Paraburkholderia sp. HC6.4b]MBB5450920.1 glycosyltransferase involved in cell wall biosynthesis [Paraburkholderia sp. Kb1A]
MIQTSATEVADVIDRPHPVGKRHSSAVQQTCPNTLKPVLRVALVVEAAGGGVGVHIADMVRGLRSLGGFEIHLVVPLGARFDDVIINENVLAQCNMIHRLPLLRSVGVSDVVAFAQLFRCLQQIKPDIVHSHSSKAGALARLCFGPWKQVYTPHAVYTLNPYLPQAQRRFYGLVEGLLGRFRSGRIIAVSIDEARHLQQVLRIPADRIETIFNGVPAPSLLPRAEARGALGLAPDAVVVGFVGRLDFQKGVDRLVHVARIMLKRGTKNVIFAIIGPGDFVAASGLSEQSIPANLRVLGPTPDARRYFSAFDIFALPSRYEGFPYVVLEAMAASVPIISTRVSGAAELIDAEQIGFVVPNEDDVTLFAEATDALVHDQQMRERMSRNCVRAAERFSAAVMVEKTVDLYKRLIKEVA